MRTATVKFLRRLACAVLLAALLGAPAGAAVITDMAGRTVTIPDRVTRVFCSTPPALYMLYALDSSLAAGLNFPLKNQETTYLRPEFLNLPVLGGWFGQGNTPNMEAVLSVKPDFILAWYWKKTAANDVVEKAARSLGLPLVYLRLNTLDEYIQAFEFLGRILHREERANALAAESRRILGEVRDVVDGIPPGEKVSVYYAQGMDGLKTECDTSVHAMLINVAGGRNIRSCETRDNFGMESVSVEEVLHADPEVILAKEAPFAAAARTNPVWKQMRAVRDGRIVTIPSSPFNWFDRPPSFMQILGACWLTSTLYPERYPKDMVAETRSFYRLFLDVDLDEAQARRVLQP